MTTNKTIKRVSKLVAGLAMTGSTMMAVGGGCEVDETGIGGLADAIGGAQKEYYLGSEVENAAAKEMTRAKWLVNHNETLVQDET